MDDERVLAELQNALKLLDMSKAMSGIFKMPGRDDELKMVMWRVRSIAERINANQADRMQERSHPGEWGWRGARDAVLELIAEIESKGDIESIFGETESQTTQPPMALHPVVWGYAEGVWEDGHRRIAVQKASSAVEQLVKTKIGRSDISGATLMEQAFSTSAPTVGKPRLRYPNFEQGSEDYRSAHEGTLAFAVGVMKRIRNLSTHTMGEWERDEAHECLAALSLLARWVDAAEVERVDD